MRDASTPGAWTPLAGPVFRAVWLAVLAGNIGTWINDVAATWYMAGLTQSPLMVAAVQAATTLPIALLALFAGALSDIVDRRRYLVAIQLYMVAVGGALAWLAARDLLGPTSLLALTFALGSGAAMSMPALSAITPELVPRAQLAPAVALNSVGVNLARSVGPAIGGAVVAGLGFAWAFGLNALSFLGLAWVLWRWKRPVPIGRLPAEGFGLALRAGLRYARHAGPFRAVLAKAAGFFFFAAATTALLPVLARQRLGGDPGGFGLLLAFIGLGALSGALLLPWLRMRMDRDRLVFLASLLLSAGMAGLALVGSLSLACVVMLLHGLAWITVVSSLQVAVQTAVPDWVRARALSLHLVVFSSGMALGSLAWGAVAQWAGVPAALLAAAVALACSAAWARRFRIGGTDDLDHAPSGHWPSPAQGTHGNPDGGPVLVTLAYRIEPERRELFLALMQDLGERRRRDGALQWGLGEDTDEPGSFLEYFLVGSWLEHLRQHERVTREDERLQAALRVLHRGPAPPQVRHWIGAHPDPPSTTASSSGEA